MCHVEASYARNSRGIAAADIIGTPRSGVARKSARTDLREGRHPVEPIDSDPSAPLFVVPKCSTTSGESDV